MSQTSGFALGRASFMGFLMGLRQRIRSRPDSEFQQALIRVVIGALLLAYFTSGLADLDAVLLEAVRAFAAFFIGAAILIAGLALASRHASLPRRAAAMTLDYASCAYLLTLTGEAGSPILVVYLWVTLGNGIRYGAAYLYAATAMATASFTWVLVFSPFWSVHLTIGIAFLLAMVAVPLYASSLIRDVHAAIQNERNASQAKNLFLANMSHEIRTPLTAIIGFSEALLDVNQTMAERVENIQAINRAGKHLLGVINDILHLTKIEAGRLEVERLPVVLFDVVDEVAAMAHLQAESKGVYFSVEPVFPLPLTVESDPVRIKQILLNLIHNAIKFTEAGGVTLRVRHDTAHAKLVLEVADTGIGISQEQLSRLFQNFAQADASTTRRYGGTGLGLALSRLLAERLGGGIEVKSTPGVGSLFTVTLDAGAVGPLAHDAAAARRYVRPPDEETGPVVLDGTLLLAEDNPDNQRLIALKARRLGVDAEVVENGAQAVAAALAKPFDLILMDMQMPEMDGLTAVRALRDAGYRGPVVALTANASQQDRARCEAAGFDAFLAKPIDRALFDETLRRHLKASAEARDDDASIVPPLLARDPGVADLMRHFVGRMRDYHARLARAVANSDLGAVRQLAQAMKSTGLDYQCPNLAELAGQLEFAATAGNHLGVRALAGRLERLASRVAIGVPHREEGPPPRHVEPPLVSELLAEDPGMADLVEAFIARLPDYETTLRTAVSAGDASTLKAKAHDLKAVGGGYGYPAVTALAIELERSAQAGRLDEVADHVEAFARLVRRIAAASPAPCAEV